jgi:hypothetical protein
MPFQGSSKQHGNPISPARVAREPRPLGIPQALFMAASPAFAGCPEQLRHFGEGANVVGGHDDQLGKALVECNNPQQVFAIGLCVCKTRTAFDERRTSGG